MRAFTAPPVTNLFTRRRGAGHCRKKPVIYVRRPAVSSLRCSMESTTGTSSEKQLEDLKEQHQYEEKTERTAQASQQRSGTSKKRQKTKETLAIKPRMLNTLIEKTDLVGIVRAVTDKSVWVDVGVVREARRGDKLVEKPVFGRVRRGGWVEGKVKQGRLLRVKVKRVNVPAARFDLEMERRRRPHEVRERRELTIPLESIVPGETALNGVVHKVIEDGAFVDVGAYRIAKKGKHESVLAYLQRTHLKEGMALTSDKVIKDTVEKIYGEGDELTVYVRAVHLANGFLWVSEKPIDKEQLAQNAKEYARRKRVIRRRKPVSSLELGTTRNGIVRGFVSYGIFVDVGVKRDGLVYWREMGIYKNTWKEGIQIGDRVVVRVLSVEDGRLGLGLLSAGDKANFDSRGTPLRGTEEPANTKSALEDEGEPDVRASFDTKFSEDYFEERYS